MGQILEAKAIISGEDRLSGILDRIGKKSEAFGKSLNVSRQVDALAKSLGRAEQGLKSIDRLQSLRGSFAQARTAFRGAQGDVQRIARDLENARKASQAFDGVKAFSRSSGIAKEIGEAAKRVRELEASFETAQRTVKRTATAYEAHSSAIKEAKRAAEGHGVSVTRLASEQIRLRGEVGRTTGAIHRQFEADAVLQRRYAGETVRDGGVREPSARERAGFFARRREGSRNNLYEAAGGIGAAYVAAQGYKEAAEFDRRLTYIGQTADASRKDTDGLRDFVFGLAQRTATPVDKLTSGLEALVAQGRSLREAKEFLPSVALTAVASGAGVDDVAKTADTVGTNFKIDGRGMQKAFDIMVAGGKAGQFELKDMARYIPSLAPAASAIGFTGEKGLSDLVAMLQVMRKGSGTSEEAVASMNNILAKMESDKTVKGLKEKGIDAKKEFEKARKEGRNLVEVFEDMVNRALKGDRSKLGDLIDDMEFKRGVQALMSYRGEWQKLSDTMQATSAGSVLKDSVRPLKDMQSSVDRALNSFKEFATVGSQLAEVTGLRSGFDSLIAEFKEIADAIKRANDEYERGGALGWLKKAAGDIQDRRLKNFDANAEATTAAQVKEQEGKIAEIEGRLGKARDNLKTGGFGEEEITSRLAKLNAELEAARQGLAALRGHRDEMKGIAAQRDPKVPTLLGGREALMPENAPPIGSAVPSFNQMWPVDTSKPGMKAAPLPPQRPDSIPRPIGTIDEVHRLPARPEAPTVTGPGDYSAMPAPPTGTGPGAFGKVWPVEIVKGAPEEAPKEPKALLGNSLEQAANSIAARLAASPVEATVKPDQIQANVKPDQVSAKLEGQADVRVTVTVNGPGEVASTSAFGSGHVRAGASSGRSMPGATNAARQSSPGGQGGV